METITSSSPSVYAKHLSLSVERHRQRLLVVILALSALLRVGTALYLGDQVRKLPGIADQITYHTLALRVLNGYGFTFDRPWWPLTAAEAPTAHWSYLYTLYLSAVYALFGPHPLIARLIQAFIAGILHPWLAWRIGRHIFGKEAGLVSAALTALYAYFVYYAGALMTETFYITAILASLYLAIRLAHSLSTGDPSEASARERRLALLLGLTLVVAVLLRQLFLLFIPFLFLWFLWATRQRGLRRRLSHLAIITAIIAVGILPFTIYNYVRFNRFVLLNTNAGYAFFWANHPIYGTRFVGILPPDGPSYQDLIPPELRRLDEAALDQALLREGLRFVIEDPFRYAQLSISRVREYFKFWPSPESSTLSNIARVGSFGILLPFMAYGLWLTAYRLSLIARITHPDSHNPQRATRNTQHISRATPHTSSSTHPAILLYLFIATYTAIHLLSWALIRYRLPVDAVLILFAAYGLVEIRRSLARRRGGLSTR